MLRIICKVVSSRVEAILDEPFNRPNNRPKPPPTNKPLMARPALTCTWVWSSPLSNKFQKAKITALGAGRIRLSSRPVPEAICQMAIKKIGTSQGSKCRPRIVPRETCFCARVSTETTFDIKQTPELSQLSCFHPECSCSLRFHRMDLSGSVEPVFSGFPVEGMGTPVRQNGWILPDAGNQKK